MSNLIRILYVDDSQLDRGLVLDSLEKEHSGFKVTQAASRSDFETALADGNFDLVLNIMTDCWQYPSAVSGMNGCDSFCGGSAFNRKIVCSE
jgi:CheY-like chemotaxis protein